MFVLVEWEHPIQHKSVMPKFGKTEVILQQFPTFDRARAHVRTLKKIRNAGRFRIRALDIVMRQNGIVAVPAKALEALVRAAARAGEDLKEGLGYSDYPDQIELICKKIQPWIEMKWLKDQEEREELERKQGEAIRNIKLSGDPEE